MQMPVYRQQDNPMGHDIIVKLVNRGKEQLRSLLAEAEALLRNLDIRGAKDCEEAIARRQEYISELRKIDASLAGYLKDMRGVSGRNALQVLDEFRTIKETAINKILELDSLVIALAGERLVHLKNEMAALALGKTALAGYENSGRAFRRNLNDTA